MPSASTPEPTSSITGAPSPHSASIVTSSTNPSVRKFDGCARRIAPVASPMRTDVVGHAGAVGRADLDEPRARLREHLGDAEAAADLDQLAARDDRSRGRRRARRTASSTARGAVVDRDRRLGPGQLAQQALDVVVARAALAAGQVELEVAVAGGDPRDRRLRPRRRAAPGRGLCGRSRRSR